MGQKHELTKYRMTWAHFMGWNKGGLHANISYYFAIEYTSEASRCVKNAYYVRN